MPWLARSDANAMARLHRPRGSTGLVVAALLALPVAGQAPAVLRPHQIWPDEILESGYHGATLFHDVDGDGDVDGVGMGEEHFVLRNQGNGRFEREVQAVCPWCSATPVLFADLDGDGREDLVSLEDSRIRIRFVRDGGKVFGHGSTTIPRIRPDGVAAADVDLDGDVDLLAYAGRYAAISPFPDTLLENDGTGSFAEVAGALPDHTATEVVFFADADGDGDPDVIGFGRKRVRLLVNDGAGRFVEAAEEPPAGNDPDWRTLRVADLDGDGDPDLLVNQPSRWLENDGTGIFVDRGVVLPALAFPYDPLLVADLTGDGLVDALFEIEREAVLHENLGAGRFVPLEQAFTEGRRLGRASYPLDADGDGDLDVLTSDLSYFLNDGAGHFVDAGRSRLLATYVSTAWTMAVADRNDDGLPDVIECDTREGLWWVLWNGGTGEFERRSTCPLPVPCDGARLVDFDGDGREELFHLDTRQLFAVEGGCALVDLSSRLPTLSGYVYDLDVDGDGDVDFLESPYNAGQQRLWLQVEGFHFVDASTSLPPPSHPVTIRALEPVDVDGDGDRDLWLRGWDVVSFIQRPLLWRNEGNAGFVDVSASLPAIGDVYRDQAFTDLDMDGDLDVVFVTEEMYCPGTFPYGSPCERTYHVLTNDGAGTYAVDPSPWEFPEVHSWFYQPLSPADVDDDGDVDFFHGQAELWIRDEGLRFERVPFSTLGGAPGAMPSLHRVDFDLDGDTDYWYSRYSLLLVGAQRHLTWRSFPGLGKRVTFEVRGPAGTPWRLFASPSRAREWTESGWLWLGRRGLELVRSGDLDAEGAALVDVELPGDPALLGLEIWWQALVGHDPRLTNPDRTVLAPF